jgi:hypothetical protein
MTLEQIRMKKEISGPAMAAIVVVCAVLIISVGWYFVNRPTGTVSVSGNNIKMQGNRGAHSSSNLAPSDSMP